MLVIVVVDVINVGNVVGVDDVIVRPDVLWQLAWRIPDWRWSNVVI